MGNHEESAIDSGVIVDDYSVNEEYDEKRDKKCLGFISHLELHYKYKDMTRAKIKKYIKKKYKVDIDIMNVKLDPELITSIKNTKGFAPAYHMNKTHWVSIIIDKVKDTKIKDLIKMSYERVEK